MLKPVIVGQAAKPFTDGTTWNSGGTALTSITINFFPESGYSFRNKDVAIVAASNGMYPTAAGWTHFVDGANIDIWVKEGSGGATDFDSVWQHSSGGSSLFYSGMRGVVVRTGFGLDGIYYDSSVAENIYSVSCTASPTFRPAVARSSFEDSAFYYRVDIDYVKESSGSYYSNNYDYPLGTNTNQYVWTMSSNYSANTSEFLNSPPEIIGFKFSTSSDLSGEIMSFYPVNYYGGVGSTATFIKRVLWLRAFNPTSQGMML
jgi:hypothetical protein